MAIRRTLPLHESRLRLLELYPECPRVYCVAVLGDLSRRRWWPLAEAVHDRPATGDFRHRREEKPNQPHRWLTAGRHLAHVVLVAWCRLLVL